MADLWCLNLHKYVVSGMGVFLDVKLHVYREVAPHEKMKNKSLPVKSGLHTRLWMRLCRGVTQG